MGSTSLCHQRAAHFYGWAYCIYRRQSSAWPAETRRFYSTIPSGFFDCGGRGEVKYKHAAEGLQQAKEYAEILGLKFAYSTNGREIVEADYTTGTEKTLSSFPSPDELWKRLSKHEQVGDASKDQLLSPTFPDKDKPLRYYQEIAVNRAVQAILQQRRRILLTLCTGAGKTAVAFQICWKLWNAEWNPKGKNRRPKILFLADRNVLVDDPKDKDLTAFGDARYQDQTGGEISQGP